MTAPIRVQLSRKKGWKMPENTVSVARPGFWGNPFKVGEMRFFVNDHDPTDKIVIQPASVRECVEAYRWLISTPQRLEVTRDKLAGKNLACWCPLDQPCHADVLLELANKGTDT
jgi:hypothetical protein